MDKEQDYRQDLASIRKLMERSSKFVSLSGLSGILAGIYALAGAAYAYIMLYDRNMVRSVTSYQDHPEFVLQLGLVAALVLVASLSTGWVLSSRRAKRMGTTIWNETSKRLFINLGIPLLTGGTLTLVEIARGYYGLVASSFLVFYGLALVNASVNLYDEFRYLGYAEIILGLLAAFFPGYGLAFWAAGFGILHIFYGAVMYKKYGE